MAGIKGVCARLLYENWSLYLERMSDEQFETSPKLVRGLLPAWSCPSCRRTARLEGRACASHDRRPRERSDRAV
jgi:hypothetical protein